MRAKYNGGRLINKSRGTVKQIDLGAGRNPTAILKQSTARFATSVINTEEQLNQREVIRKQTIWQGQTIKINQRQNNIQTTSEIV